MRIGLNNRLAGDSARKVVCQVTLPKVDAINGDDCGQGPNKYSIFTDRRTVNIFDITRAVGTATATFLISHATDRG